MPRWGGLGYRRHHTRPEAPMFAAPAPAPPTLTILDVSGLPVLNQGQSSECVPFSDCLALWLMRKAAGLPPMLGSPSWLYGMTHQGGTEPEGTDPLLAAGVLQQQGVPPWDLDPFPADGQQTAMQAWESVLARYADLLTAARPYRTTGVQQVPVTLEAIQTVLGGGRPVLLAGEVFPAYESPQPMRLQDPPPVLARLLGGSPTVAGVVPGSWLGQQGMGGHQWLCVGVVPYSPSLFPEPLSEGCQAYLVCITSWGRWLATGPEAVFLLPDTYLGACYEATAFVGLAAASPLCRAIRQAVQVCEGWLRDFPDAPPAHRQAVEAYVARQRAEAQAAGCGEV